MLRGRNVTPSCAIRHDTLVQSHVPWFSTFPTQLSAWQQKKGTIELLSFSQGERKGEGGSGGREWWKGGMEGRAGWKGGLEGRRSSPLSRQGMPSKNAVENLKPVITETEFHHWQNKHISTKLSSHLACVFLSLSIIFQWQPNTLQLHFRQYQLPASVTGLFMCNGCTAAIRPIATNTWKAYTHKLLTVTFDDSTD